MYGLQGMHSSSKEGTLTVTLQLCLYSSLSLCLAFLAQTFITYDTPQCLFLLVLSSEDFLLSFPPNDSA
jgi:hypothetical protein